MRRHLASFLAIAGLFACGREPGKNTAADPKIIIGSNDFVKINATCAGMDFECNVKRPYLFP